jgi:regulator of nonsense transcripts 2
MVTDTSAESRKVDKKTALALWDSTVLPPNVRKKRVDEPDEDGDAAEVDGRDIMSFTVITRRGNKQHVIILLPSLPVPHT